MQFVTNLPQTTQIGLAIGLSGLLALLMLTLRQRRVAAATPADEASRGQRRRRKGARHDDGEAAPRRRRRKLAAEASHALGEGTITPGADIEIPAAASSAAEPDAAGPATPTAELEVPAPAERTAVDDPYVTAASAPAAALATGDAVAQPGWPSPGELASGFDPDAFDPLPPARDGDIAPTADALVDVDAWLEDEDDDLDDEFAITSGAESTDGVTAVIHPVDADWDADEAFDPATGWVGDEDEPDTEAAAHKDDDEDEDDVSSSFPAETDDDAGELEIALVSDDADIECDVAAPPVPVETTAERALDGAVSDDDDATYDIDAEWEAPEADDVPLAPQTTADDDDWDEPLALDVTDAIAPIGAGPADDDDPLAGILATDSNEALEDVTDGLELAVADGDIATPTWPQDDAAPVTWEPDSAWSGDADDDLTVPFPTPGTLPEHETTAAQLIDVPSPLPAVAGRIDAGQGQPVVIDLAGLVALGERVEVVIAHDESGVRLSFGPSGAVPQTESTAPDVTAYVTTEKTDAFAPDTDDSVEPPVAVGVAVTDEGADDSARILADIRSRLAALDRRRLDADDI